MFPKYAIRAQNGNVVILSEEQRSIYDEIREISNLTSKGISTTLDFYQYQDKIVRDGDDGVYLSEAAQEVIKQLYHAACNSEIPTEAELLNIQLL